MQDYNSEKTPRPRFKKRFFLTLFGVIFALFISMRVYYYLTDDFSLYNISGEVPYKKEWNVDPLTASEEKTVNEILAQPFHYLGRGAQSFAFTSADNQYVIKFFKFKHLRSPKWIDLLPNIDYLNQYKNKIVRRKQSKLDDLFNAYRLAYGVNRDESALIFIQLNTINNPSREVTVYDKMGFRHNVELAGLPFILQRKGQTLRTIFDELIKNGDKESVKDKLDQIVDLYASEYIKGIYDHDHGVMHNAGFIGDQPIHLDVGKLSKNEHMRQNAEARKDIKLVAERVNAWFKNKHPDIAKEIAEHLDAKIDRVFGSKDRTVQSLRG